MARITIEDCLKTRNNNRFDIIIEASKRARQILEGSEPRVNVRNDKPPVIALREIADSTTPTHEVSEPDSPFFDSQMEESTEE